MKKTNKTSNEHGGFKKSEIIRILTEEEALLLRARPGVSVAVVIILTMISDKKVKAITITEKNKNDSYSKTKFPSGGLEYGEHPFAGAKRESRTETGWETEEFLFAWGAEYSTTVSGETHYKLFIIARNPLKVGEPIFDGNDEILSVDWRNFTEIEEYIVKGQRIGLQPIIDKMRLFDRSYAEDLMNMKAKIQPEEGVYDVRRREE